MRTLREALEQLWRAREDARMVQAQGRWHTWGEIRALSERIGAELSDAGFGAGDRVAVVLGNRPESIAVLLSAAMNGWTLVTLNPLQPPARMSADLLDTGVGAVLGPADAFGQPDLATAVADLKAHAWSVDGDTVKYESRGTAHPGRGDADVQIEMLTSGTTGPPKRVPLTRKQLEASLAAALGHHDRPTDAEREPFSGAVALVTIPIVHIGGLWGVFQALTTARPIVLLERFSLQAWAEVIREHRPKLVGLPPPAIRTVLDSDLTRDDLASVRAINAGTSPVSPELIEAFMDRFGVPILVVYGATEFSGAVAGWTLPDFQAQWSRKRGSVGRGFPGVGLRIVDDAGAPLPADSSGRLQVSTPQAGAAGGEWITTSDLAHLDEDGFLYIDGRADDVIIRGGFKVAPETVAAALRRHPAVADAAVLGVPDDRLGQVPVAAVELRPEAAVDADQLRAHCRSTLTPYEVPAEVHIVDALPRGAALKVDRRELTAVVDALRR